MNRKNTLIVMFVVIGALVVSAFSLVAINNNEKANLQRGRAADAARYTAMAVNYTAQKGAILQRGREADAARYTAMARSYEALATVDLSWPPRPDFSVLIAKPVIPVTGSAAGLAIYHQSERNSTQAPEFHYGPPGR